MMTGRGSALGNAGGFGRMGTTLALLVEGAGGGVAGTGRRGELAGGEGVRRRGGGTFGAAMASFAGTLHSCLSGWHVR
jgi:hypothetical protein